MALKTLLTDLTAGANAYPNHNTPSTAGGFNYGKSYTPVFETVLCQDFFSPFRGHLDYFKSWIFNHGCAPTDLYW